MPKNNLKEENMLKNLEIKSNKIGDNFLDLNDEERNRDEDGRIIITDLQQIPKNMTEEEEAKFWAEHTMSENLLDETFLEDDEDELPPPKRSTKQINIRMETELLERLQSMAKIKDMPYQTLLKQFVVERLYEEEKREKVI